MDSALGTWSVPDDDRAMVVPCPAASAFLLEANYTFGSALPLPMAESLRRTVLWIATPAHRRAVALGEKEHTAQVPVMGSRLNGECRIWLQRAPFLPARRLSPLTVTLRPLDIDRSTAQLLLDESAPQTIIRRRLAKP